MALSTSDLVADSLSAIKYAKVRVVRDDTGLAVDYVIEGPGANSVPQFGNNDDRVDQIAAELVTRFMRREQGGLRPAEDNTAREEEGHQEKHHERRFGLERTDRWRREPQSLKAVGLVKAGQHLVLPAF